MVNFSVVVWQAEKRDRAVPSCTWNPIPRKRAPTSKGPCSHAELLGFMVHISSLAATTAGASPAAYWCIRDHGRPCVPKQHMEFLLCTSHNRCAVAKMWVSPHRPNLHSEVNLQRVPTGLILWLSCTDVVPLLMCRMMQKWPAWPVIIWFPAM